MYPEASITVPMRVTCDQGVSCTLPAGWYLDGAPISDFQNSKFRLTPDSKSAFTLKGESLEPGAHVLEFRINPEGLPGAEQASFALNLVVREEALPPAAA